MYSQPDKQTTSESSLQQTLVNTARLIRSLPKPCSSSSCTCCRVQHTQQPGADLDGRVSAAMLEEFLRPAQALLLLHAGHAAAALCSQSAGAARALGPEGPGGLPKDSQLTHARTHTPKYPQVVGVEGGKVKKKTRASCPQCVLQGK